MGDARSRVAEDFRPDAEARLRLAESILHSSMPRFDDPADHLSAARTCLEELNGYNRRKPNEKTKVTDDSGATVEIPVATRREQLSTLVDKSFQKAIGSADSKDLVKLMHMLTSTDALIKKRQAEIKQQGDRDLFSGTNSTASTTGKSDVLNDLTLAELQLLKVKLESLVNVPCEARLEYAAVLSDRGDLNQAQELLGEAALKGARGMRFENLLEDVKTRLRRQELAGGEDPIEMARAATNKIDQGHVEGGERMLQNASKYARNLNTSELKQRLNAIEKELASADLTPQKKEQLKRDKKCLEQLTRSDAALSFCKVALATAKGHYEDSRAILERAAKDDPQYTAEHRDRYLDMMTFAKTKGLERSVSAFHGHLVSFQRYLSPNNFSLENAQSELDKAISAAQSIPLDDVKKFKEQETQKLEILNGKLKDKSITGAERSETERRAGEVAAAIHELELLQQAPQLVKSISEAFQVARKKGVTAKEMFSALERDSNRRLRLGEIEKALSVLDVPPNPRIIRERYLTMPGPKVNPAEFNRPVK